MYNYFSFISLFVALLFISRHLFPSTNNTSANNKVRRDDNLSVESAIYTGWLQYRNIEFSFVFDKNELHLIPPREKVREIELNWIMTPMGNGVYTMSSQLQMDEPFLVGRCNENGHKIIFITRQGAHIGSQNSVLFVDVVAFIECKMDRDSIDRISFSSPEIDCIHPVNQAFEYSVDGTRFSNDGVFSVTALSFDSTTTEKQVFAVDGKEVQVYFGVTRKMSTKIGEAPMSLSSAMLFEFEATDDYTFILRLWHIAKEFIRFLCYRKNVYLPITEIFAPYKDGKHEKFATLYIINESGNSEPETLKSGRYIKQKNISGFEGAILTDITDNLLYTRHFPNTYESGRHIDASRFIMIIAAFEWEFHRTYPDGVPRKEATIKVETEATEAIQKLIESSSGKLKKKFQFLKKLIKSDSLQTEIVKMGEDFDEIIGIFGKHLYQLNGENLIYTEMGERLANQRNHFAHGDLDKDFIGLSLLDLMYMEYVVYALQLKLYGINEENIRKTINELFHLNYAL